MLLIQCSTWLPSQSFTFVSKMQACTMIFYFSASFHLWSLYSVFDYGNVPMTMILWYFVITANEKKSIFNGLRALLASTLGFNLKLCSVDSTRPNSTMGNYSVSTLVPEDKAPEDPLEEECSGKEGDEENFIIPPLEQDIKKKSKNISEVSGSSLHVSALSLLGQECNAKKSCASSDESDPVITQHLLMQAGDVESNPGPTGSEGKLNVHVGNHNK